MSGSRYFPGDERAGTAGPDGPATWPDLDREGLLLRTFGDRDLAGELLDLFEAQCLRLGPALADPDPGSRAAALHMLRGAALAVGALRVAHLASGEDMAERTAQDLRRAIDDVVNVIRSGRPDRSAGIVASPTPGSHVER